MRLRPGLRAGLTCQRTRKRGDWLENHQIRSLLYRRWVKGMANPLNRKKWTSHLSRYLYRRQVRRNRTWGY